MGGVHGGWYATLLDSALGCAVHTKMPVGRGYTTAELSVNLVRAIGPRAPRVRAEGRVLHAGRQLATAEARLVGPDGTLYAHATTTCLVFRCGEGKRTPVGPLRRSTYDALMPSLDNVFWQSLDGPHRALSVGTATARRYAPGYSPIAAFATPREPDLAALAPFCEPGERLYCADWDGPAPDGWRVELQALMVRMAWQGRTPDVDAALPAVPLRPAHVEAAVALAALTRPGPFGPRTLEMGEYLGVFDRGRLVAMAGERTCTAGAREVSGVCTHPDHQGRGHARKLMRVLIARQLARGELPYLHVMGANATARGLYERMGFRTDAEMPVRVIARG